jgi:hypothetical protein
MLGRLTVGTVASRIWKVLVPVTALALGPVGFAAGASARELPAASRPASVHALATPDYRRACTTAAAGRAACLSLIRTNVAHHRQPGAHPDAAPSGDGYGPSSLQSAYSLPSGTVGSGQTVAVVDAFDDPNAASDLAAYRSAWGLPACGAGCFTKVNQNGAASPLPSGAAGTGWDVEESLDIDMVSAICPLCHIILVETNSASFSDLGTGVDSAVNLGAKFVSNSYGGGDSSSDTSLDTYYNHPGVAVTASAGDSGFGVEYPAASQYVTAVGGTSLTTAANARGWTETVWSGTGSGCSGFEPKPSWQHDTGCAHRTNNDVAAVADPNTGVAVYDTYTQGGWLEVGGTSAASPIIASTFALAGTPTAGTYPSSYLYLHTADLHDVTSGSDGSCSPAYLCTGETGYDGPTGWGTPDGTGAFSKAGGVLPQNLLQHGSFEASAGGWATTVPSGGVTNMVDYQVGHGAPATAQDGSWYLAFNTSASSGSVYQDVPVNGTAGSAYTATAWLSAQSGTATGQLCLWGLGATNTSNCRSYSVTAGTYTPIQLVYDAPQAFSTLRFQVYPAPGGGTTDMDTASLQPSLLQHGSFEASAGGWATTVPSGGVTNIVDYQVGHGAPATAQDGSWYLAFNTSASSGSVYQDFSITGGPGASYAATAWLSAQSGTATGQLCLWGLGATNTSNCRPYSVTAGTYTPIQLVYDAPQAFSTLRFQVYPAPGGGTTDMDTASIG